MRKRSDPNENCSKHQRWLVGSGFLIAAIMNLVVTAPVVAAQFANKTKAAL